MRPCLNRPTANPKHLPKPETYFGNRPIFTFALDKGGLNKRAGYPRCKYEQSVWNRRVHPSSFIKSCAKATMAVVEWLSGVINWACPNWEKLRCMDCR